MALKCPPVASAAVCSKAVIHCLLLLPLFVGCPLIGPCFVIQYLALFPVLQSSR